MLTLRTNGRADPGKHSEGPAAPEPARLAVAHGLHDFLSPWRTRARNSEQGVLRHLDVEMETGTGKTYCYIKTIFEMNKRYGWTKFIIVVPSIAIREGVYKSLGNNCGSFPRKVRQKSRVLYIQLQATP